MEFNENILCMWIFFLPTSQTWIPVWFLVLWCMRANLSFLKLPKSSLTYSLPERLVQVANMYKGRCQCNSANEYLLSVSLKLRITSRVILTFYPSWCRDADRMEATEFQNSTSRKHNLNILAKISVVSFKLKKKSVIYILIRNNL